MRVEGWQDRLLEVIEAVRSVPFAYPSHDCCTFAARCVDAITGSSIYADLSAKYTDEASAMAYLAAGGGLELAVSEWMGASQAPNWAGPGDVIMGVQRGPGPTLGICLGLNCVFAGSPAGVVYANRSVIQRCWKVD